MNIFQSLPNRKKLNAINRHENEEIYVWYFAIIALLLGLFVFLSATFILMNSANASNWSICGSAKRITCVVDGDTFWKDSIKYRLYNVDTPEAGNRAKCSRERNLANKATLRLQSIFKSGKLKINEQGRDGYGRVLALVSVNGANVSALLISDGVGKSYRGGKRDPQYWCK